VPYIKQSQRELLDGILHDDDFGRRPCDAGELNYVITRLCLQYVDNTGGVRYGKLAEVTGVLENVKQEFYRRLAAPYEDAKIAENGDVYPA
jgi:hypothetical protein